MHQQYVASPNRALCADQRYASGMANDPKPYPAAPDELRAIDDGLTSDAIPEAELPAYYRREAARLRALADTAETIEMRVVILENAERLDRLAQSLGETPT